MKIKFRIFRFDPDADTQPHYSEFFVEAQKNERVLDCLNRIKWTQDGTLSYRMSCAHGVCGSDAMRINGKCSLACQKLVKDFDSDEILVEPLPSFRPLKDLIVDMTPFFERVAEIRPYLIASNTPERERIQSPEDRKKMDLAIRCILCACCSASCPVVNDNNDFRGPAPLVQAFRRIFDSRDEDKQHRLDQLNDGKGAWACVNHFECTKACPKEIPVTKCINMIKSEIKKTG